MARQTGVKKEKPQRPRGIPGDRFQVELRGHQYFVVDAHSGLTYGGPYRDREIAQEKADGLNRNLGWRR